jgi:hypothetical protein
LGRVGALIANAIALGKIGSTTQASHNEAMTKLFDEWEKDRHGSAFAEAAQLSDDALRRARGG